MTTIDLTASSSNVVAPKKGAQKRKPTNVLHLQPESTPENEAGFSHALSPIIPNHHALSASIGEEAGPSHYSPAHVNETEANLAASVCLIPPIKIVSRQGSLEAQSVTSPVSVQAPSPSSKVVRFPDNSSRRSASAFLASLAPTIKYSSKAAAKRKAQHNLNTNLTKRLDLENKNGEELAQGEGIDGEGKTGEEELVIRSDVSLDESVEAVDMVEVQVITERWGMKVGDVVWAKMKGEPWWPSEIFAFNAKEEETCVLWLGGSSHGFVGPDSIEAWVPAFKKRYNKTRKGAGYQAAVADGIRRHSVRAPNEFDYYQELAPIAVRALALASKTSK